MRRFDGRVVLVTGAAKGDRRGDRAPLRVRGRARLLRGSRLRRGRRVGRAGGGAIVNTASISGLFGDYGLLAYDAAKGDVVNLTRALAIDHAREGIRVNAVCPGPIETSLTQLLVEHPVIRGEYASNIPMGRVGKADEVAAAIAFLASDDAAYVTGATLVVDGGVTAATGQAHFTRALTGAD
ncbi:MAG: hypothetical protein DCC71_21315 [Proteobacteria bacterium]|nr:MAG: hypothetical protein DCC71_21315 [Pseudomonadota bacterium]